MKKTTKKAAAKAVKDTASDKPKTTRKIVKTDKVVTKTTKTPPGEAVEKPVKKIVAAKPPKSAPPAKPAKTVKKAAPEKKLTDAEITGYRASLEMIRARLSGDVQMMTDAALNKNRMEASGDLSVMPIHMADVGSDNFEQEQTLAFMQSESGLLDLVEDALERIEDGTYGVCESCQERIPRLRLNFLPFASMCVQCANIAQQEET